MDVWRELHHCAIYIDSYSLIFFQFIWYIWRGILLISLIIWKWYRTQIYSNTFRFILKRPLDQNTVLFSYLFPFLVTFPIQGVLCTSWFLLHLISFKKEKHCTYLYQISHTLFQHSPKQSHFPELNTSCLQHHSSSRCTVLTWQKQHEYYCLLIAMKSHRECTWPPLGGSLSVCGPRHGCQGKHLCQRQNVCSLQACTCVCGLRDVSMYVISEH